MLVVQIFLLGIVRMTFNYNTYAKTLKCNVLFHLLFSFTNDLCQRGQFGYSDSELLQIDYGNL